jgi:hypothetical protein
MGAMTTRARFTSSRRKFSADEAALSSSPLSRRAFFDIDHAPKDHSNRRSDLPGYAVWEIRRFETGRFLRAFHAFYKVRLRSDKRGAELIFDALPFRRAAVYRARRKSAKAIGYAREELRTWNRLHHLVKLRDQLS